MEIVFVILLLMYFMPTVVAMLREAKPTGGIAILNFFLGWTLIGWVAALVWAVTAEADKRNTLGEKKCPACAEMVKREAKLCKHCGTVFHA